jgi:hypothetical protein
MRNFTDEMNMGSTGLMAMAKSKANKFQADALVEIAENGGTPAPTGGTDWAGVAGSALKGFSGLFDQNGGGAGMGTGNYGFDVGVGIGDLGVSGDYGAGSWDLSSGLFSDGALDSIGSLGF